mgnify:CR=1 FL=1
MEKNIVKYVMNNKGELVEKIADYIGVEHFSKTIEALYRECLEKYDNAEDIEEYLADSKECNIQSLAWSFTLKTNKEMKSYLHKKEHSMSGNFADIERDYPAHITGTRWSTEYDGDDYFDLFPQMVARLDAAEDSKQATEDRTYLEEWYFSAFGTFGIMYNFSNELAEISSILKEEEQ